MPRTGVGCGVCVVLAIGALLASASAAGAAVGGPSVTATPVSAIEGAQFTAEVGKYTGGCPTTASVDWGDGTADTQATLSLITGTANCEIVAAHTYAEEGTYTTTVTVTPGSGAPLVATSTATVADGTLSLKPTTLNSTAGTVTSGTVATLDDSGGLENGSHYVAQIDWGDGHSSAGTVGAGGAVTGSHTYATPGTYPVQITVTDDGGQATTASASASISPATPPPCNASPPTAAPPFNTSASTPNSRWIEAVYHDLLGQTPSAPALNYFGGVLAGGIGREVIVDFLEGDPDRPIIIGSLYNAYLRRAPNTNDVTFGTQYLAAGGTDEGLAAILLGSPEYLQTRGGGSTTGFLGALYCDVLRRGIDQQALNTWQTALADGTTPTQVAQAVLASPEYRTELVQTEFLRFLRRLPGQSDSQYWATQLGAGLTDEAFDSALLSSQEYFNKFAGSSPALLTPVIRPTGVITVTLRQPATLALRVLMVLPPGHAAHPKLKLPVTRLVGTVPLGHHGKGHVRIRWNRKVGGHRLRAGSYVLVLEAKRHGKVVDLSDATTLRLR